MMHRRRLVGLALAVPLTLAGAGACQASPGVAAHVGDARISEQRVDAVVADLRDTLQPQVAAAAPGDVTGQRERLDDELGQWRDRVMTMLVLTEAGEQYATAEGLAVDPPSAATAAELTGLTEDHAYVAVYAGFNSVMNALGESVQPAEPTEADQREVYEHLEFQGQPMAVPFEEVQPLLTAELLGRSVALRDLLTTVVERADVRVQPGYDLVYQVPVQLGQASSWLGVRISEPSQVVDAG